MKCKFSIAPQVDLSFSYPEKDIKHFFMAHPNIVISHIADIFYPFPNYDFNSGFQFGFVNMLMRSEKPFWKFLT